ncbi:hypothetical protein NKH16_30835, partial [Mesorhizobium sp. M1307]|uniref:hypothetical protein n=1 Tax=Mesorhizobium sp. M1307 TaxID=2957079 RepID=UPI00333DD727
MISPLEEEMAGRPEGVAARRAPASIRCRKTSPVEPTPSVAFGDISPLEGRGIAYGDFGVEFRLRKDSLERQLS